MSKSADWYKSLGSIEKQNLLSNRAIWYKSLEANKRISTVAHNCHGKTKSHGTTNFSHGKTKLTHGKTNLTHGKTKLTHGKTKLTHGKTKLYGGPQLSRQNKENELVSGWSTVVICI